MKKSLRLFLLCIVSLYISPMVWADEVPTINPIAKFTDSEGIQKEDISFSGSAPITGEFFANPKNTTGWNATYEWRFTKVGDTSPYLVRYEENTEFTITESGEHHIELYATFTQGNDSIKYTEEYWNHGEGTPLIITVTESSLTMPNAFSPNGDNINDIYKAKDGYKSIVKFKAVIYNRWGQKIFEWDNPAEGWDGTFHGKDVEQGVYFVHVEAKGADGKTYNIKRDVNLLRGYTESSTN